MTGRARKIRLTDAGVARLRPRKTEYLVWDSQVAGLGVRVRPSGHRSFVWHGHANGAAVRVTVGSAALTNVEKARRECPMLQNGMELSGRNDWKDRLSVPFFQDFVMSEWWPAFQRRCARSWCRSVDHVLRRRLLPSFGRLRLNRIGRPEVERWFDAYSRTAPGGANNALQLLGQIMNSAVAAGHTDTNPTRGIRKNPRRKLTRFLSGEEIDRLHRTLDRLVEERPSRRGQADIIRLLLLTGCRRGEILRLKWSEVDGPVLRLAETKTGAKVVHLGGPAIAVLRGIQRQDNNPWVIAGRKPGSHLTDLQHPWRRIRARAGLDDVRIHDLRHSFASGGLLVGEGLPMIGKLLGHTQVQTTARYAHLANDPVKSAANRIAGRIAEVAG